MIEGGWLGSSHREFIARIPLKSSKPGSLTALEAHKADAVQGKRCRIAFGVTTHPCILNQ